ncbi:UNVERIFIED_CONTAM: hypothetical protein Sangu_2681000 [Sesamum angustifolium]|uniref:Uncharacterized protein n=1 Tax=Sesamum angustifolium TaxID=2727405 RepID=A0AAW2J185_9LAMI
MMYENNLSNRVGLTLEYEGGVTASIVRKLGVLVESTKIKFPKPWARENNVACQSPGGGGSMCYPSDVEAWRYFDWTHPDFVAEPHNVRLGLYTYGFVPHRYYGHTYTCWSVIATQYNLPTGMCMSSEYMFLMMLITGPSNSKYLIDAYLEPLIEELQILWHVGVLTRDSAKDETFTMRTALICIVNVLPTYGMASGWSTAGVVR